MRCIKAHRACGGYEDPAFSFFRLYEAHGAEQSSSFITTARKCTMPKRTPLPGTDILPEDILPSETSSAQSNMLALRAFFYDYCILPTNSNLSRGYLSGLEQAAERQGTNSDLVKACQAVSFMTHGKPLNRPKLMEKASIFYQELLGSLAKAMDNPHSVKAAETRMIVMLLGIYQVITLIATSATTRELS